MQPNKNTPQDAMFSAMKKSSYYFLFVGYCKITIILFNTQIFYVEN